MSVYNYPAARCPSYKKPIGLDDCLPQARPLVKKKHGRTALGPVKKGDKILIVTLPDQEEYVQEAIKQVLREEGAEKVNFIKEHELNGGEPRVFNIENGWKEADTMENSPWDMSGQMFYSDISEPLCHYLTKHPEYSGVFYGLEGRRSLRSWIKEYGNKFRGRWLFNNWEEFLSKAWTYPDELEVEIERRIINVLGKASAVRITDPEGTHLGYPLSVEEAKRWQMKRMVSWSSSFRSAPGDVRRM